MIVSSGDARLATEARGPAEAPTVLFVHAGVTDRRSWRGLVDDLSGDYRCITYDRRGYGETTYDAEEGWSADGDALAVLEAYHVPRALVVACSVGGRTAADLALARPDRVQGLVLVAPAISGAPNPDLTGDLAWLEDAYPAAEESGDLDELNRLEAVVWLDGPRTAEGRVQGAARDLFLAMNRHALEAADPGEEAEPEPAWPRLEDIGCPTLLLVGEHDLPHIRDNTHAAAGRITGAAFAELPGVAHLPQLEDRPELLEHVRSFLAEQSR